MTKVRIELIIFVIAIFLFTACTSENTETPSKAENEILQEENKEQNELVNDNEMNNKYDFTSYMEQPEINYSDYIVEQSIKGLYVTAHSANNQTINNIIDLANRSEVNAVVIDIKDDNGYITIDTDVPLINEIGSDKVYNIKNIEELIKSLKEQGIYTIARIVCFKDPYLAKARPEYAIKNHDGTLWTYKNIPWLNPYTTETWEYIVDVAEEAVKVGFDEIQFDYIRFEATSRLKDADLGPKSSEIARTEVILQFLDYANERLDHYGVQLSADVFGVIITSEYDSKNLGQDYIEMAKRLDVICPMIYPSHYGPGSFGYQYPDKNPYGIIKAALDASNELYKEHEGEKLAKVRPWLQSFTAKWLGAGAYISYGPAEMREQIKATYDTGWDEWIFWNSRSLYSENAFLTQ